MNEYDWVIQVMNYEKWVDMSFAWDCNEMVGMKEAW